MKIGIIDAIGEAADNNQDAKNCNNIFSGIHEKLLFYML